jgi:hypothetical protein
MGASMTGEQIEIVGWRYEVYSEMLDTWTAVTTFTQTAPEICERAGQVRRLTPLVAYNEIIARSTKRRPADSTDSDRWSDTAKAATQRTRTLATARNGHEVDPDDDHD